MTTIRNSTSAPTIFFNLNGLDYPKSAYDIYYADIEVDMNGDVDLDKPSLGIRNKYDGTILVSPRYFDQYTSDGVTPFASWETLWTHLTEILNFNTASGGSGAGGGINPNHIFTGVDRSAAETARDTYFVANPDELIAGTEIFLIFGTPEESVKQVRSADSWVDQNDVLTAAQVRALYLSNADTNNYDDAAQTKNDSQEAYADFGLMVQEANGTVVLSQVSSITGINQYEIALSGHTSFTFSISNDNSLLSGIHMIAIYNGPGQAGEGELIQFVEIDTLNFVQETGYRTVTVTGGFYTLDQFDTTARLGKAVLSPTISLSLHKRQNFVSGATPDWNQSDELRGSFIKNKPVTITPVQADDIARNTANYVIETTGISKEFTIVSNLTGNNQILQLSESNPPMIQVRQDIFDAFGIDENQAIVFTEGTGRANPGQILGYAFIRVVDSEFVGGSSVRVDIVGSFFNQEELTPDPLSPFSLGVVGQNVGLEVFDVDGFIEAVKPDWDETDSDSPNFIRNKPTTISTAQVADITANTDKLANIDDFATETFSTEEIELQRDLSIVANDPTAINQVGIKVGDYTELVLSLNDAEAQLLNSSDFLTLHEGVGQVSPGEELVFGIIDNVVREPIGDIFNPDYIKVTITGRFDRGFNHSQSELDMLRFGAVGETTTLRTYRQKNHSVILRSDWDETNFRHPAYIQNKPTVISAAQAQAIIDNDAAITVNTDKLANIDDFASETLSSEAIHHEQNLLIVNGDVTAINEITLASGDFTEIVLSTNDANANLIEGSDFLTLHEGPTQVSPGDELVFGVIRSIVTEPVGDIFDPDYIKVTITGRFDRGFNHQLGQLNPLAFGAAGLSTTLRTYRQKNHSVVLRSDWNQSNFRHPAYIQNKPTVISTAQAQAIIDNDAAITVNTNKLANIDDFATENFVTQQIDVSSGLTIVDGAITGEGEITFVNGNFTEISFSVNEADSLSFEDIDFLTLHEGVGQSNTGVELVFGKVDSVVTTPVGADMLNPDYILVVVTGVFNTGFSHQPATPLSFGAIGQQTIIRGYSEKNHAVVLQSDWTESNVHHPAYINNKPDADGLADKGITTVSTATTITERGRHYEVDQSGGTFTVTIGNPTSFGLSSNSTGQFSIHNSGADWLKVETTVDNFKGTGNNFMYILPGETRIFNVGRADGGNFVEPLGRIAYIFRAVGLQTTGLVNTWIIQNIIGTALPTDLFENPVLNDERLVFKAAGYIQVHILLRWLWNGPTSTIAVRNAAGDGTTNIYDGALDNVFMTIDKNDVSETSTALVSLPNQNNTIVDQFPILTLDPFAANDYLTFEAQNVTAGESLLATLVANIEYVLKTS